MICETKVYQVGRYTVRQQPHFDNPAFPQYLVFLKDRLIGKQFSVPSESDCQWLERQAAAEKLSYTDGRRCKNGRPYTVNGRNELYSRKRAA